jgi:hypothetical protein
MNLPLQVEGFESTAKAEKSFARLYFEWLSLILDLILGDWLLQSGMEGLWLYERRPPTKPKVAPGHWDASHR